MASLKAHFDGQSIVLDEPATLAVGQAVRVLVETACGEDTHPATPPGESIQKNDDSPFTPFADMTATLMNGDEWDESTALHIDPLQAIPADFVRRPGSAAGQIKMADDFNATPDDFQEYL